MTIALKEELEETRKSLTAEALPNRRLRRTYNWVILILALSWIFMAVALIRTVRLSEESRRELENQKWFGLQMANFKEGARNLGQTFGNFWEKMSSGPLGNFVPFSDQMARAAHEVRNRRQ